MDEWRADSLVADAPAADASASPGSVRQSRRQFLTVLGALGPGSIVGAAMLQGLLAELLDPKPAAAAGMAANGGTTAGAGTAAGSAKPTRQWAMAIDLRKCEGCVTSGRAPQCTEACNAEHFVPEGQEWIKVFQVDEGLGTYFLPRPCMQCENAPCLNVCPVGATYRNAEGVILIDHGRCIGCRMCMAACPYGARSFNWDQPANPPGSSFAKYSPEYPVPHRRGTVEKCMLCAHRVEDGRLPACVEACPMNALYLADLVDDVATNGQEVVKFSRFLAENSAYRLKEDLGTRPRVWYIPGHGQAFGRHADDEREPESARAWQAQGVTYTQETGDAGD